MTTAVKNERLELRFEKWDRDGNGRIDRSDLEAEANRILAAFGESPSTPQGRALLESFTGTYEYLAEKAGVGRDGALDRKQFTEVIEAEVFKGGDAGFGRVVRPMIQAILNVCDTDGDGEVNPAEFAKWLKAAGVDRSKADESFRTIDTDGSGALTVDELVAAVKAYHFGTLDVPLLG
ncbi:EF-hand domain-containing protein [Umezawaea sp. Da 62-37]|uniref:EF-hand domain-containing protein n=1 Tax=Umezawaea sp. Da 62-37 TaxID=3075927 RepID=UPI0028F6DF4E|nr:EF-hand domain-containing protein [Umezawaea sp. Da 62-37]WNV82871.1 EF-hand domain-containing protein [Umezawaea sp. Da 62-37]